MKIMKRKTHGESENYWQPATDIMVGLLLVIILVMSLLLSYIAQKNNKYEYDTSYSATSVTDHTGDWTREPESTTRRDDDNEGGGGHEDETTTTTMPNAGGGGHPSEDEGKTAVLVSVIDAETGNIIKKGGIMFELYAERDANGGLQALHTYYPVKLEYKQYETDKNGRFYLPEKIVDGWYSLHNLSVPEGYEPGENTNFQITKPQDWDDPFLVSVPLSPAKNIIKINAIDSETKDPVPDGVYEIIADQDIVTLDGSVRLKNGEVADVVTCDEKGYAESKELYLGKYRIRPKKANAVYALSSTVLPVEVKKTADSEIPIVEALCDKTTFTLTLNDAFTEEPIEGAVFIGESGRRVKTSDRGEIVLTDLQKGQTYSLTLQKLPEPYRAGEVSASFTVNNKGLIKGEAKYAFSATAYAIRLSASVDDRLLHQVVNDINLTLYDRDGKVVESWDSNGTDHIIEGLEPGSYQLEIGGRASTRKRFEVKDVGGMQYAVIYIWTVLDFLILIAAAVLLAVLTLVTVRIIRRKKKVKTGE